MSVTYIFLETESALIGCDKASLSSAWLYSMYQQTLSLRYRQLHLICIVHKGKHQEFNSDCITHVCLMRVKLWPKRRFSKVTFAFLQVNVPF